MDRTFRALYVLLVVSLVAGFARSAVAEPRPAVAEPRPAVAEPRPAYAQTTESAYASNAEPTDEPGPWLRTDTDHFTIIYRERDEDTAREVLNLADRVWRDVTAYLAYQPRERIPVVIYGGTARANGYFSPYPPHIALFVSSPIGPWLGARTESWIETVFIHELIHYVHLTRPIGFFGSPSRVFGPLLSATGTLFMPGWTVEGIAVHGESYLAPGGRGDNPFFEMQAIAPVLEQRMYNYDQAGHPSVYTPSGRIYTGGYLLVDYLLREHGERTFVELNRTFQQAPFLGMRRAIRRTTGQRAPDFFDAMVEDLEERYAPRRALPDGTRISPEGPGNWYLPVPTDRGLITWARDFNRGPGLYLYTGGGIIGGGIIGGGIIGGGIIGGGIIGGGIIGGGIIGGGVGTSSATSTGAGIASGSRIAATTGAGTTSDAGTATTDTAGLRNPEQPTPTDWQLLAPADAVEPWSWTVDRSGTRAVVSVSDINLGGGIAPATGENFADLFVIELPAPDSRRPGTERLTTGRRLFQPALSPEGTRLVAVERVGSLTRLVEVNLETGAVEPLWTPPDTTVANPTFSPEGDLLALTANRLGTQWIVILDSRTGAVAAELRDSQALYFPRFTVGGNSDAESGEDGIYSVEAADVEGGVRQYDPPGPRTLELWYSGDRGGELALYRSAVTGSTDTGGDVRISPPQRVLRDQVGAWAGFPVGPVGSVGPVGPGDSTPVIYGGYTADGYTIKVGELRPEESDGSVSAAHLVAPAGSGDGASHAEAGGSEITPEDGASLAEATGSSTPDGDNLPADATPIESRRYRDLPRPVLWLPQAWVRAGSEGEDQFDLGVFATAASNLGRHRVDVSILYNFEARQPSGEITYTFAPGAARWSLALAREYEQRDAPVFTEERVSAAMGVSRSLWYDRHPGFHRFLAGGAALRYESLGIAPGAVDAVTAYHEGTIIRTTTATVGLRLARSNVAATRDFFGGTGRELYTELAVTPDLLDNDGFRLDTTTGGSVRFQPLRRLSGMIGALQVVPAAYGTTSTAGKAPERRPYRSGGFGDAAVTLGADRDYAWLLRGELRVPLGIHDAAWRGLATTGSGVSFYAEQGGVSYDADEATVAGGEFTMDIYFNMIPLRVTAGAAFNLPHPGSDTDREWTAYFRLGGPVAGVLTSGNGPPGPER